MLGLKDKGKPREFSSVVDEEANESRSVDSDNNKSQLQASGHEEGDLQFEQVEPHMSFAPQNSGIPTEGSEVLSTGLKLPLLTQHRQSIDSGNYNNKKQRDQLTDFTVHMLNFTPVTVLLQLCQQSEGASQVPFGFHLNSVVMVAELKNFYDCDKFDADQAIQNETLVEISGQFLEITNQFLNKYGGDMIQFMGNSLVAIWPTPKETDSALFEVQQAFCHKATQCALDIQKDFQKIVGSSYELAIGIGFGEFDVLHVGGILNRVEYFVAGTALLHALTCLRATTKEKQVAVSNDVWKYIEENFAGLPEITIEAKDAAVQNVQKLNKSQKQPQKTTTKCVFIQKVIHQVKIKRDLSLQRKADIDIKRIKLIESQVQAYIPGGFRSLSSLKSGEQVGQHMQMTVLCMAIDLAASVFDSRSKESRVVLQAVTEIVQTNVYRLQGSITKLLSYEGGLIVIATWGIQMLSHTDDPQRAIFAAHNIKKQLSSFQITLVSDDDDFEEPPFHAGIASGLTLQGVIGNGQRREIVLIGQTVERALLLMQNAVKHYSKIYCDYQTKQLAAHCIDLDYVEHFELASKVLNQAVYQPNFSLTIEQKDVFGNSMRSTTAQTQSKVIKLHSNPFFLDRDNNYQRNFSEAYGKIEVIVKIIEDIQSYVRQQAYDDTKHDSVWALAVRGPIGSGKSLFSRRLIHETSLKEKQILRPLQTQLNSKFCFQYIVSSNNQDISLKFLGAWRPFLRLLLKIYSEHMGQSQEYTINTQVLYGNVSDKVIMIEEIFGLKHLAKTKVQIPIDPAMTVKPVTMTVLQSDSNVSLWGGIQPQKFKEEYENCLIVFCLNFIMHAIQELKQACCFFFLIDNASLMNRSSWNLFNLVTQQVSFLVLVLNMETRSDFFERTIDQNQRASSLNFRLQPDSETLTYYTEFVQPREREIFNIADMTPLTKKQFKQALLDLALVYKRDFTQEIQDLTSKKDVNEKVGMEREEKEQLKGYFQTNSTFSDVSEDVLDVVISLSQGNPLFAFWFAYTAIIKGYLIIRESKLMPATKFQSCLTLEAWNSLELPCIISKHMSQHVESKLQMTASGQKRQNTSELVYMLRILQEASLIGTWFSSRMLASANRKPIDIAEINCALDQLEDCDLIEMVYNEHTNGERYYRFNHQLAQQTLYQMQLFSTMRKPQLEGIITYLKDNVIFNKTTDWSLEKEFTLMMRYTMELQNVFQEDRLDRKSRQTLVVKRLNQRLCKNSKLLQTGFVRALFKRKGTNLQPSDMQEMLMVLRQKSVEFYISNKRQTSEEKRVDEDKGLKNWGIKSIKNIQDFTCLRVVHLKDVMQLKETEKFGNDEGVIRGVSKMLNFGKREENASHKNFVFKIKCRTLHDAVNKLPGQHTVFIQNASDRKQDINEAENWMTAIEFLRTKLAFEEFAASYGPVPFPLPSLDLQRQSRPAKQFQRAQPIKALVSELKTVPFQNLHGTFAMFNQASSVQIMLPASQIDYRGQKGPSNPANNSMHQTIRSGGKETVQKLAKKLKTLFGITYLSFLGHMQAATHSSLQDEDSSKPVLGSISSNLQTQFRKQVDEVLDFNMFTQPRLGGVYSSIFSPIREENQESQEQLMSPESFAETLSIKKFEIVPQLALQTIEDQTMHLFREEKSAYVSRLRQTKGFVHGSRMCEATMCRLDTDEDFNVVRRYDILGYNLQKKAFVDHTEKKKHVLKQSDNQIERKNEMSIMALQNDFKMPNESKRKEKGQVIEKILENSSKPWYLQTPPLDEQKVESAESEESKVFEHPIISPKTRMTESYRNHEGAYMAFKRQLVTQTPEPKEEILPSNPHSKQPSIFQLLEEGKETQNSQRNTERVSHRLTTHSHQTYLSSQVQSRRSNNENIQSFHDAPDEVPQLLTTPTLHSHLPKRIPTSVLSDHSPAVTDQAPISYHVAHDPLINQGLPAVVVSQAGAPCILLNSSFAGTQKQIYLSYGDLVYVDRDLFVRNDSSPIMLTKCYFFAEGGVKIDIVIARDLLRVIGSDQQLLTTDQNNDETDESFYSDDEQIELKGVHETSADNLLKQSPTLLNLYSKPKTASTLKAAQNVADQMKNQATFTKLQQRRMERLQSKQAEIISGSSTQKQPTSRERVSPETQRSNISAKLSERKAGVVISSSAVPHVLKVNERRKQRLLQYN